MEDLFDDPGDLGFFDEESFIDEDALELDNEFYIPAPGEWEDEI
jgi:hypothetical protein